MGEEKTKLATKLAAKEAKLTQVENQLMALEREKKDESEEMKNLLEEVQQDVEKERRDVVQMKAEMRGETEQTLKGLREEKTSLAAKVGRMEVELEKREAELERCEMRREEVEMKLAQAKDDEKTANAKVAKNLTDLPDDMAALDRDLTKTQGDLKREGIARERTEELLSQARIELDNVQAASTKTLEALRSEKASLQRDLEETKAALHVAADKLNAECDKPTAPSGDDEETASLKLEVVDIQSQLSAAQATIAELESRDIVLGDVARADIARLETRIAELEMELQAAAEEGSRHVAAAEAALAEVSSLAERAAAAEQESEQIQSVVAECDAELLQAKCVLYPSSFCSFTDGPSPDPISKPSDPTRLLSSPSAPSSNPPSPPSWPNSRRRTSKSRPSPSNLPPLTSPSRLRPPPSPPHMPPNSPTSPSPT